MSVNAATSAVMGQHDQYLLNHSFASFLDARDQKRWLNVLAVVADGTTCTVTVHLEQTPQRVLVVTHIPLLMDGLVVGMYGIARDVTEDHATTITLESREARYRSAFEYAPGGMALGEPLMGVTLQSIVHCVNCLATANRNCSICPGSTLHRRMCTRPNWLSPTRCSRARYSARTMGYCVIVISRDTRFGRNAISLWHATRRMSHSILSVRSRNPRHHTSRHLRNISRYIPSRRGNSMSVLRTLPHPPLVVPLKHSSETYSVLCRCPFGGQERCRWNGSCMCHGIARYADLCNAYSMHLQFTLIGCLNALLPIITDAPTLNYEGRALYKWPDLISQLCPRWLPTSQESVQT